MLIEAPVTTQWNKAASIDIHDERILQTLVFHLADTSLIVDGRCHAVIRGEGKASLVQIRLAVTIRPPQLKVAAGQLLVAMRTEAYLLLGVGRQRHLLLKLHVTNPALQGTSNWLVIVVAYKHSRLYTGGFAISSQLGFYIWIAHSHITC